jgi:enamine deaminase RidA (YjgF/YER057c/UK114 family)
LSRDLFKKCVTLFGSRSRQTLSTNGVSAAGEILEGLAAQTELALNNVAKVLETAGGRMENVVKMTIFMVRGVDPNEGYATSARVWGPYPTAISAVFAAALGHPEFLVEIGAVAAFAN